MSFKRFAFVGLVILLVLFSLACRTAETIAQLRATPQAPRTRVTRAPTRVSKPPTAAPEIMPTEITAVTDIPAPPTNPPPPAPSTKPPPAAPPTKKPAVPPPPKPTNTVPPASPTLQFKFRIQESRCGPNVRTYIEGFVYENNQPKNDVLVRISQGPDGQPDPNDDYRTGTDPRKGYFFQNIDSNAPHAGTWYLWIIDPGTQQRISEIAIVKTDAQRVEDTENSSGSCQSATIKFSTSGPVVNPTRTVAPTNTRDPNAQPTPTQDPLDDS